MRNSQVKEESSLERSEARAAQIIPLASRASRNTAKRSEAEARPASRRIFFEDRWEIFGLIKDHLKTDVLWLSIWQMMLKTLALLGALYLIWKSF